MILSLLVLSIFILILGYILEAKRGYEDWHFVLQTVGIVLTIVFLIIICVWGASVVRTDRTIDSRIQLYEEYNQEIKLQVDTVAREYVDYESSIYENFSTQDILLIVPELDANTVIMEQIALYEANQLKILELREKKLDLSADKFILYWGE